MAFISVLGCDGSGKSAVINALVDELQGKGVTTLTGHWCPKTWRGGRRPSKADDPHGQAPRGMLASLAKLLIIWCRWWYAWVTVLGTASRNGMVVYDRYHADMLVDPLRYRYGGPIWLARVASRLMPQPDLVFYLDAAPEVLLSRKREVGIEALQAAREKYLGLARQCPRVVIIDAAQDLEIVTTIVMSILDETLHCACTGLTDSQKKRGAEINP